MVLTLANFFSLRAIPSTVLFGGVPVSTPPDQPHLCRSPRVGRRLILHYGDLTDSTGLRRVIEAAPPDEIYNLGAQSHVKVSFENPEYTADADALGTLRLLDCMRDHVEHTGRRFVSIRPAHRKCLAPPSPPRGKTLRSIRAAPTPCPRLPRTGTAINYREAYNLFISNGILFNHESPRRGETFVTRKITRAIGRIRVGLQDKLYLGISMPGAIGALQVIMSRRCGACCSIRTAAILSSRLAKRYSVREFLELAFSYAGLDWRKYVIIDPQIFPPNRSRLLTRGFHQSGTGVRMVA